MTQLPAPLSITILVVLGVAGTTLFLLALRGATKPGDISADMTARPPPPRPDPARPA